MSQPYPNKFKQADIVRREIQLIKIAQKQLGMDDDTYRGILWTLARVKSSTELDFAGRKKVLEHMKKCGFTVKPKSPLSPPLSKGGSVAGGFRPLADDAQSKKIRALWLQLHEAGKVRNPEEAALAAFVKRMTRIDALQWLSTAQASRVIEELKKWLNR